MRARAEQAEAERDSWRRVAVIHGAEVQADHDYMERAYGPVSERNDDLEKIVGDLSDRLRQAEGRAEKLEAAGDEWQSLATLAVARIQPDWYSIKEGREWLARYEALVNSHSSEEEA